MEHNQTEKLPPNEQKERRFRSSRFFKILISLAVIIMIAIPTGVSVHTLGALHETERELTDAIDRYEALSHSEAIWYGWEISLLKLIQFKILVIYKQDLCLRLSLIQVI